MKYLSSRKLLDWLYVCWDAGRDAQVEVVEELYARGWDDLGWLAQSR